MQPDALLGALARIFPADRLLTRPGALAPYESDGLTTFRARPRAVVFVLGDSHYYGALGFEEAIRFGWRCTYDVPSAAFRVRLLGSPAAEDLPPVGTVRYHEAFDSL